MEEDDDPPVDDDFELHVDLEAVDVVVSFVLAAVSLDFNAVASDSILAATAPVMRDVGVGDPFSCSLPRKRGHMPCP